jgi:hypothetical protein
MVGFGLRPARADLEQRHCEQGICWTRNIRHRKPRRTLHTYLASSLDFRVSLTVLCRQANVGIVYIFCDAEPTCLDGQCGG